MVRLFRGLTYGLRENDLWVADRLVTHLVLVCMLPMDPHRQVSALGNC